MQICEMQNPPKAEVNAYATSHKDPISTVKIRHGSKQKTHMAHCTNSNASLEGIGTLLTVLTARPGNLETANQKMSLERRRELLTTSAGLALRALARLLTQLPFSRPEEEYYSAPDQLPSPGQ
jgi:hypothetical protein